MVLEAAAALLVEQGPEGLSTRRVAERVGASTQVVYTLFGGKAGLADALFRKGFSLLKAALRAVPDDLDPLDHLLALERAYRASALAEPALYQVMFGRPIPGYDPPPASLEFAWQGFELLVQAVARAVEQGALGPHEPREVARVLWALAHGMVSLELAGHLPDDADPAGRYDRAITALIDGYAPASPVPLVPTLGGDRDRIKSDGPDEDPPPRQPPTPKESP